MVTKKSSQANLEDKKGVFVMMGFILVLSLFFIVMEWSKKDFIDSELKKIVQVVPEEELIPITMPDVVPPPPPPPVDVVEKFEIVDNTINVSEIKFTSEMNPTEGIPDVTQQSYQAAPEENNEVIMVPEIFPEFNGNVFEYLSKNMKYPVFAQEIGLQGKVICQFVVNRDGSIVDVVVVRSVDPSLDKEAIRVIKSMPNWKPGRQNGKPVRVKFTLPVNFKLM